MIDSNRVEIWVVYNLYQFLITQVYLNAIPKTKGKTTLFTK